MKFIEKYPEFKKFNFKGPVTILLVKEVEEILDKYFVRKEHHLEHHHDIYKKDIEEYKQKVKDGIHKSISRWNFKYSVTNEEVEEHLLKELGLDDD